MRNLLFLLLVVLISLINCQYFNVKKIDCAETDFKEQCEKNKSTYTQSNYIHISYLNKEDSQFYHYVFTTANGPSLLLAHSDINCELFVDFEKILNGSYSGSIKLLTDKNTTCPLRNKHLYQSIYVDEFLDTDQSNHIQSYDLRGLLFNNTEANLTCNNSGDDLCYYRATYMTNNYLLQITFYDKSYSTKAAPYTYIGPLGVNVRFDIVDLEVSNYESKLLMGNILSHEKYPVEILGQMERFYSDEQSPSVFSSFKMTYKNSSVANDFNSFWHNVAFTDSDLRRVSQILAVYSSSFNARDYTCQPAANNLNDMMSLDLPQSHCYQIIYDILNYDNYYSNTKYIRAEVFFGFRKYFNYQTPILVISVTAIGVGLPLLFFTLTTLFIVRIKSKNSTKIVDNDSIVIGNSEEEVIETGSPSESSFLEN